MAMDEKGFKLQVNFFSGGDGRASLLAQREGINARKLTASARRVLLFRSLSNLLLATKELYFWRHASK